MTNKARNIYIDTTGFTDEAKIRVHRALSKMSPFRSKRMTFFMSDHPLKCIGDDGYLLACKDPREAKSICWLNNPRQVWLFELESLAGIR